MLLNEATQTEAELERKALEERIVKEGMILWKRQQEFEKTKKLKEQQEMREIFERYWPFGKRNNQPRGFRNIRPEGIFPIEEYRIANRFGGSLELGKPGGGAPLVTATGRKVTKTREDPLLRFQFGKDLRKCVDNNLRYKKQRKEQQEYKKELDKLVQEKKEKQKKEKEEDIEFYKKQFLRSPPWGKPGPGGTAWRSPSKIGFNFLKSLGWSSDNTLRRLREHEATHKESPGKVYDKLKSLKMIPSRNAQKLSPIIFPSNRFLTSGLNKRKLTPLLDDSKDDETDLVTLLAKNRTTPVKLHLCTTDATNDGKFWNNSMWTRTGSAYLKDLNRQITEKERRIKDYMEADRLESYRHFLTLDSFWGRPGHGAPRNEIKKQRLNQLLYHPFNLIAVY